LEGAALFLLGRTLPSVIYTFFFARNVHGNLKKQKQFVSDWFISKSLFEELFEKNIFYISFHSPVIFLYFVRTLNSPSLFLANEKFEIKDDYIWITN
jgi:hypothetical protein